MNRFFLSIMAISLLAAGAAFGDDPHTIAQQGRTFRPNEVTINHGELLTFTNNDEFIHQIYVTGLFDSEERSPGENITESFPQCGNLRGPLPYPPQDEARGAR